MPLDAKALARQVTDECGLEFEGRFLSQDKNHVLELVPAGITPLHTFSIRTTIGWRSVEVAFVPDTYAADFVRRIGEADEGSRLCCSAVLRKCQADGASTTFRINGSDVDPLDTSQWSQTWSRFDLVVRRGQLELGNGDGDSAKIAAWTQQVAAALIALLPLEETKTREDGIQAGFPEGSRTTVLVNRYERDRRNRAAALAIHGFACAACIADLGKIYGDAAAALIEVHHVTPVSRLGDGYRVDPANDLVPLCSNCHRVAHRRDPPYTVAKLRAMLGNT